VLKTRESVRLLKEYHPPLGDRDGVRLDFNENTVGCSRRVLERLKTLTGEDLARYPVRDRFEPLVAEHLGVEADELLLTNGTDEAIHLVCETYLEADDEVVVVVPTFAMFEIYAAATGARVIAIPAAGDFTDPLESVLKQINKRTRLIAVANPNNPTGAFVPIGELVRIAEAAPDAAVLIDEAYFEFCGESAICGWRGTPNIFVTRTFSKAYGMAGLRIGALMGHREQMKMLRRASSPYNLNSVALECLPAALSDGEFVRSYVAEVKQGRSELEAELQSWGVRYWKSRANFVLLYLGQNCKPFIRSMRKRGILVRDRSSDYGCKDCVRITLGTREHNARMLQAAREIFAELGTRQRVAP
jgi:histidinol-phosphate aminotransferase